MSQKVVRALCALLAPVVAGTAFSFAGPSEFTGVFGSIDASGCKGPCDGSKTKTRYECYDLNGPPAPCNPNYCGMNEYQFAACAVGPQGAEDPPCQTHVDNNDWFRRLSVRQPTAPCSSPGENAENIPPCSFVNSSQPGQWVSPCGTSGCQGPTQYRVVYNGRIVCGP